jgi:pimeloyl-ACP methyl ester carboxylesterase
MRKYLKWVLIGIVVLLVIVAVYPFVVGDMETIELNDAVRASMPDQSFVKLSDGYTHYEWAGPENGQPVVLVHGAGTPMFIWDYQFSALADAGFHVLRYDLFGRGLSDRPSVYNADLYDRQLLELLDSQGIKTPVDLAGISLGGTVTIQFIDRHPERVRKFALFGVEILKGYPLSIRIFSYPLIGEWLIKGFGDRMILSNISRLIRNPEKAQEYRQKMSQQMRYKGFKRAILAILRDNSLGDMKPVYERVGRSGKPGILFMGTNDSLVPFSPHTQVQAAIPSIEFHAVEGAGHDMIFEMPEAVNPLLIEFLKRWTSNVHLDK